MLRFFTLVYVVAVMQFKLVQFLVARIYGVFMAVRTKSKRSSRSTKTKLSARQILFRRYFPAWVMLAIVLVILLPHILATTLGAAGEVIGAIPGWISNIFSGGRSIAPLFTEEVAHWESDISRWAKEYDLDPNLLATVMQIESCGHPTVNSVAGAQGLFQVMPFHFEEGENHLHPDTNAKRGANFLRECGEIADGDIGLTLACYNGGQSVVNKSYSLWPAETQRYYIWGTGIYGDAINNSARSDTLDRWLAAGGSSLCDRASAELETG